MRRIRNFVIISSSAPKSLRDSQCYPSSSFAVNPSFCSRVHKIAPRSDKQWMSTIWRSKESNGAGRLSIRSNLVRLNKETETVIVPAHLRALEAIYFTAMLEEGRVFQVVDQLVELFAEGVLPVSSGP